MPTALKPVNRCGAPTPFTACGALGATVLMLALAACGGGGGSPAAVPPLGSACLEGSVARVALAGQARAGRNTEVALVSCGPVLTRVHWAQTGGAALTLGSARSPALSLQPEQAGNYRFALRFQDEQGTQHQGEVELPVAAADPATITLTVRGEPSVWSGGALSLRAWPTGLSVAEQDGATLNWSVIEGPTTLLPSATGWSLKFNAPQVARDSLLRLRAELSLPDGRRAQQEFSLLVQPPPQSAANPLFSASNAATRTYPYLEQGPYAAALAECVYAPGLSFSNPNNLCTLGRLPLLGQTAAGGVPSVEEVMQRVLVSNDWMGEVLENFLRTQDTFGDFRRLLAATTAIVIGGRVRPSFYWNTTGAIYLDASSLWLTPEQRDSVSETADPRSGFADALNYAAPWRYVLNNRYAFGSYPVRERRTRDIGALRYELGWLLYHELAHANDFIPPRVHASLRGDLRVYEASPPLTASQDLAQRLPLMSAEMKALARVRFLGDTATPLQIGYTPDNVAGFFSADRASDHYSYTAPSGQSFSREDLALLVEEAMMQLRYGVLRDQAYTDKLASGASSADSVVRWGQRGRVGEAAIRPRVALVLADVMPWLGPGIAAGLAPPLAMRPGQSWGNNLDQAALASGRARPLTVEERRIEAEQTQQRGLDDALQRRLRAAQATSGAALAR